MASNLHIDLKGLPRELKKLMAGMESFPPQNNPLLQWRAAYGLRTLRSPRPNVGSTGEFRGNPWPALKPQYTRKDGTDVPVWGGVPRVRSGHVTQATNASQRYLKYMDASQLEGAALNVGVVQKGQSFTAGNVLGKLRRDGTRYRASDPQLSPDPQRGLLGDFALSDPLVENQGKKITIRTSKEYAIPVHNLRPFAIGPQIDREENADLLSRMTKYFDHLLESL